MSVNIANAALDRISVGRISSLSQRSDSADVIRQHIDIAARLVLRQVIWSEETTSVCLDLIRSVEDTDTGTDRGGIPRGFRHAFALPKDFIRAKRLNPEIDISKDLTQPNTHDIWSRFDHANGIFRTQTDFSEFRVHTIKDDNGKATKALVANCDEVELEYVFKPADLDTLDVDIIEAISLLLAYRISSPLKTNASLRAEIKAEYDQFIEMAGLRSAAQDQEDLEIDGGPILEARFYGAY